jgi:LacI family transcriptional regulator
MTRKATAADVAQEAGVSRWTVIRAFEPGGIISDKSRDRVMEVAGRLGYRPNLLARSLTTKTTHQIAVLVDDFSNVYKLFALEKLTAALQAEGLVAMLIHIGPHVDHANAFLDADQRQVDAVVLLGTGFREETLQSAIKAGSPPLFVLARESTIEGIPSVACDAALSLRAIVDHLAGRGYRRPAFMSGPKAMSTSLGRQRYFSEYWAALDVPEVPELAAGAYDFKAAEACLRKYFDETPAEARMDVLMCENDVLALGAMDMAQRKFGLRVPEDLAIVGYDGNDLTGMSMFDLTTYEQPMEAMIAVLVDMLQGRREAASVTLPGRLIARGST